MRRSHGGARGESSDVAGAADRDRRERALVRLVCVGVHALLGAAALWLAFHGGGTSPVHWELVTLLLLAGVVALAVSGALPDLRALPTTTWLAAAASGGLVALALASLLWTPSRALTLDSAALLLLTAAALLVAAIFSPGPRHSLAGTAVVLAVASLCALAVLARLLAGDTDLFQEERLAYPISYANGVAALFFVGVPPAIALSASPRLGWTARGAAAALAGLLVATGLLAVSRGALIALAISLTVLALVFPSGGRLLLVVLAVGAGAAPALTLLFAGSGEDAGSVRSRGVGVIAALVIAGLLGLAIARFDPRLAALWRRRAVRRAAAGAAVLVIVAGAAGFTARFGDPVSATRGAWDAFSGPPPIRQGGIEGRLGSLQSNRHDYWRVSYRAFREDPVLGLGAGAFPIEWYRERAVPEHVTDAHGWPFDLAAELGLAGPILFLVVVGALVHAGRRTLRRGSATATAGAAAVGAATYFLLHSTIDWTLQIPALVVLGMLACGALLGASRTPSATLAQPKERVSAGVLALACLVFVAPFWISERYVERATGQGDPSAALASVKAARSWNPASTRALQVEALVRLEAGDATGAARALRAALANEPSRWEIWAQLSDAHRAAGRETAARAAFARARQLNPRIPSRPGRGGPIVR